MASGGTEIFASRLIYSAATSAVINFASEAIGTEVVERDAAKTKLFFRSAAR